MTTAIRIISLTILVIYLFHDYKRDKGEFILQKVLHSIILTYFTYSHANAFVYVGYLVVKFQKIIPKYYIDLPALPKEINLLSWFLQVVLSCFIMYAVRGMMSRKDESRKLLLKVLPFTLIVGPFGFYRGFISETDGVEYNALLGFLLGILVMGSLNGTAYILYSNHMMKDFFYSPSTESTLDNEQIKTG